MLKIILNTYNKRSKKFHIVMQENFEFMFLLNFIFNKFIYIIYIFDLLYKTVFKF